MASTETYNFIRIIPREADFLSRRVGSRGEIFWDRNTNTLKLFDGETKGGLDLARSDLSNISNSVFAAKATSAGVGGGGGGGSGDATSVTVGNTLPTSPENGNLWLNTDSGFLYVYINDGDSAQWVQPASPSFSGDYDDLSNKPSIPTTISSLTNDAGYLTTIPGTISSTILGDDSTLLVDTSTSELNTYTLSQVSATDGQVLIWNTNNARWEPGDVSLGSFSFTGSNIDTTDSSAITVTPAITMQSDLTVENDLISTRAFVTDLTISGEISTQGSGTPEIVSDNEINLTAGTTINLNGVTTLFGSNEVLSSISGATGIVEHNFEQGAIFYHTSIAANFTANFTNILATNNRATSIALILDQGSTPYIPNAVQISGASQTINWQGGSPPTGTANQTDVVSFTLFRQGNNWLVIGSLSTFA